MAKKQIDPGPFVLPMPTVLVGALVDGKPNFMTAAFVGIANYQPPTVACGLNPDHHTCRGIEANGAFSLNLPPSSLVQATDWCGLRTGSRVDKAAAFEVFYGADENAPMIDECRLTLECKLIHSHKMAVDTLYLGEVTAVHIDEAALREGQPHWPGLDPILFTFPDKAYWKLGDYLAPAWKAGQDFQPR